MHRPVQPVELATCAMGIFVDITVLQGLTILDCVSRAMRIADDMQ